MKDIILLLIGAAAIAVIYKILFMKDTHVHIHYPHDKDIKTVLSKLDLIIKNQEKMGQELDSLTSEVQETKGIMASAKVLIEGFAKKLEEAGTDKVKLTALKEELNSGSEELAAALTANPLPTDQPPQ